MHTGKTNLVKLFAAAALLAGPLLISAPRPVAADTTFPQTGQTIWGPFEQYWKDHGALSQFELASYFRVPCQRRQQR